VSALAFGAGVQAEMLAASAWDGTVRLWSLRNGASAAEHMITYTHAGPALCLCWEGSRCISGGADKVVRSLDPSTATLETVGEHTDAVIGVATTPQHASCIFSASLDRTVQCWDTRATVGGAAAYSVTLPERAYGLAVQWPYVLVATANAATVQLLDMRQMPAQPRGVPVYPPSQKHVPRSVALLSNGANAPAPTGWCVGGYDGRVGVGFDQGASETPAADALSSKDASPKWGESFSLDCHRVKQPDGSFMCYAVHQLAFDPRRPSVLATAGGDGVVALWDLQKRKRLATVVEPPRGGEGGSLTPVPAISYAHDGEMLAYTRSDDWGGGEERYQAHKGSKSEVCIAHCTAQWLGEAEARQ
tara:strand:+ start:147 stop:1226 length:1080 start_codon:yes stop_codon:yes gene_type:complete